MIYVRNSLLELHIRTESQGSWSKIAKAALRIGTDTLEVDTDSTYYVNGVENPTSPILLGGLYPVTVSSGAVTVSLSGGQFVRFRIYRDNIAIQIDAHGSDFMGSNGMTGAWSQRGFLGRDGSTLLETPLEFALEWEVSSVKEDPILFLKTAVSACIDEPIGQLPADPTLLAQAQAKCATLPEGANRINCVFDILASGGDLTWADTAAYTDPFSPTTRCIPNVLEGGETCESLGGTCVWKCAEGEQTCVTGLCSESSAFTNRRRMQDLFVEPFSEFEGCSCAFPKDPSRSPSSRRPSTPVPSPPTPVPSETTPPHSSTPTSSF